MRLGPPARREPRARCGKVPPQFPAPLAPPKARRYHGWVRLDPTRVGRDASQIADEVIAPSYTVNSNRNTIGKRRPVVAMTPLPFREGAGG